MSQDNKCWVCLYQYSNEDSVRLRCLHTFHKKCIRSLYRANKNRWQQDTLERLYPTCPLCRTRIHARDLNFRIYSGPPPAEIAPDPLLQDVPAYARIPEEDRPMRLARELQVIEREIQQRLLAELIERRKAMLARQALHRQLQEQDKPQSQGTTSSEENIIRPSTSSSRNVLESDSDEFGSQSKDHQSAETLVIYEPEDMGSLTRATPHYSSEFPTMPSPGWSLLVPNPQELQGLNAQITIVDQQIQNWSLVPFNDNDPMPDSPNYYHEPDSDIEDEDGPSDGQDAELIFPIEIVDHLNRGRHTRYIVLWSDGSRTMNRTRAVEVTVPELLVEFRRKKGREATARARERQRSGERPKIPGRGRGSG